jgi:hypothetical protein
MGLLTAALKVLQRSNLDAISPNSLRRIQRQESERRLEAAAESRRAKDLHNKPQ